MFVLQMLAHPVYVLWKFQVSLMMKTVQGLLCYVPEYNKESAQKVG